MTTYARILSFIRPYRLTLALSIICSIFFSIFSGVSIYLIIPLLQTLFAGGAVGQASAASATGSSFLPGWLVAAKDAATEAFRHAVFRPDPRIHSSSSA